MGGQHAGRADQGGLALAEGVDEVLDLRLLEQAGDEHHGRAGVEVGAAARDRVLQDVAAVLVAGGLTLGAALAVAVAGLTRSLVFGLEPRDPATLAEACGLLAAVAFLASVLPARRAARLDPVETLRHQ